MRKMIWAVVLAALVGFTVVHAQSSVTYTLQWNHDGVNTNSYSVQVDTGTPVPLTYTCTGAGATRACNSTVTMTTSVSHNVIVIAVGTFGSASSAPFTAAPPTSPTGVIVVKFP